MTKQRLDHMEDQLSILIHEMGEIKIGLELIREKQASQAKRHDGIKESFQQHREGMKEFFNKIEKRLHALEDFMLASLQRLAYLKGFTLKALPALLLICGLCFSMGIFVDDAEKNMHKSKQSGERLK